MNRRQHRTSDVRREEPRGTRVIALGGEHGFADAARLKQETREVWPGASHVIVDFSDATFIDSSVINWLLRAQATPGPGFALSIVEGDRESFVGRLFARVGLHEVFACYETRGEVARVPLRALSDPASHVGERSRARWVERAAVHGVDPARGVAMPAFYERDLTG